MKLDGMDNMMMRIAEGDKNAFDKMFFMYYPKVQNYLSHFISSKEQAEDIIHNISKYANSQNKINMSDFNANDAYHNLYALRT